MKQVAWIILSCIITMSAMEIVDLKKIKECDTDFKTNNSVIPHIFTTQAIPKKKKLKLIKLIKNSPAPLNSSSSKNFLRPTLVVASTLLVATSLYQVFIYSDNSFEKPIKIKELAITSLIAILPLRRLGNIFHHWPEPQEYSLLQEIQQALEESVEK